MGRHRALIITADDFGAGESIDRGIVAAVEAGIVTAVSALTNYPRAAAAVAELHRSFPELGIGVHLNLTSGFPLTAPSLLGGICSADGAFQGLPRLLTRLDTLDLTAVDAELRRQVAVLTDQGIPVDHLSSHHNVLGIYPPFLDLMARLALEFDAPVRTPVAVSQTHSRRYGYATTRKRAARSILGLLGARPFQALSVLPGTWIRLMNSKRRLARAGVRHPDHLIDALFGRPTEENLRHIIGHLPPGVSELVVHLADPATTVDESDVPRGIDGDEFPNRIEEQRLITAPWIPTLLSTSGVQRTRFRALRSRP